MYAVHAADVKSLFAMKLQLTSPCVPQPHAADVKSLFADWKDETHENAFLREYNGTSSKPKRTQFLDMAIMWDHFNAAERALDSSDEQLDVDKLDLARYIKCTSITTELVKKLLDKGVDPNARKLLDEVFHLEDYIPRKLPLIMALVEKGAEIDRGSFFKMVELALKKIGTLMLVHIANILRLSTYSYVYSCMPSNTHTCNDPVLINHSNVH